MKMFKGISHFVVPAWVIAGLLTAYLNELYYFSIIDYGLVHLVIGVLAAIILVITANEWMKFKQEWEDED